MKKTFEVVQTSEELLKFVVKTVNDKWRYPRLLSSGELVMGTSQVEGEPVEVLLIGARTSIPFKPGMQLH